ncbi:MAG: hypothetical protein CM15mP12_8330 [Gammaproteobacteria bacterium]|nr:MAG: hypothetical protein CM15mP12_8330 [Gammaproteobacteria bacterium]
METLLGGCHSGGLIGSVVGSEGWGKISRKEGIELGIKLEANKKEISLFKKDHPILKLILELVIK